MVATIEAIPRSIQSEITECSLTVEQLVRMIQELNPTATPEYLGRFKTSSLERYLAHLSYAHEPRGPRARWERPGDTPAILAFTAGEE